MTTNLHDRTRRAARTCMTPAPPIALTRTAPRGWRALVQSMSIGAHPGETITAPLSSRALALAYGLACYAVFFATFCYAAGFVGDFLVPTRLDGPRVGSVWSAIAINTGLILLFGVQHSVMARPWFKAWWTRFVPAHLERSTYVLFSSLALIAMFIAWRPMGGVVWDLAHPVARAIAYAVFAAGWLTVLCTTFLINHFDLFGLRQVWLHFRGRGHTHLRFATPGPYRFVRHPLYVGWLLGFWATPTMTAAHLLFAAFTTVYILCAIRWEERDLLEHHGADYRRYREQVPMLVPTPGRAWGEEAGSAPAPATA